MLGLCGTAAGLAIIILALILGYTVVHGISYLNLDFLTQATKPVGEVGGGMRNEIFGTLILVVLASIFALRSVYWQEFFCPNMPVPEWLLPFGSWQTF